MHKCKKNVMWKDSVAGYVKNGLINCYKLNEQLLDETYKIDKYSIFTVHEPKEREIVSTRIKDRVFQKSLCNNYVYDEITKSFIYDNCACQVNKGTDFARDRLCSHMQRYYRKHGENGFVLTCDIQNYFGDTLHSVAKEAARKRIKDDWAYTHITKIIDSFNHGEDPEKGLGLGSEPNQLTQLAVLDDLDHLIKEELKIKQYVRYMDDIILIHPDKEYLKYCLKEIDAFISGIELKLSCKKTQIFPLKQGIKFLGFTFYLTNTGKVVRILSKENIKQEKRKLRKMKKLVDEGTLTKTHVDKCYTAWKAHAKKGNTYNLLKSMDRFYNNLWEV